MHQIIINFKYSQIFLDIMKFIEIFSNFQMATMIVFKILITIIMIIFIIKAEAKNYMVTITFKLELKNS